MKFTFAVEAIDLTDKVIRVVYTPENPALAPYHGTIQATLAVLALPPEEAKDTLRKAIVAKAPLNYWQAQLEATMIEVPQLLSETIGEAFEVTEEEHQGVVAEVGSPDPEREVVAKTIAQQLDELALHRLTGEGKGIVYAKDGVDYWFDTSVASQNRFASAQAAALAGARADGSAWKCAQVTELGDLIPAFLPLTNAELLEVSALVLQHVQRCFDVEAQCTAALLAGSPIDFMDTLNA